MARSPQSKKGFKSRCALLRKESWYKPTVVRLGTSIKPHIDQAPAPEKARSPPSKEENWEST